MSAMLSEELALVATIDPDAYVTGVQTSDYVNMENFKKLLAIVMAGTAVTTGVLNAKLRQATTGTGANAKDITDKAITGLASGDNDKQALINLDAAELDVAGGFSFVALQMTANTAGFDAGAVILAGYPRYAPANDNDLASVDEIVS